MNVSDFDVLNAIVGEPVDGDRRRSSRQVLGTRGLITREEAPEATPLQVTVTNVAVQGVGFESPVSFQAGSVYRICIGDGPLQLCIRMRIKESRPREGGAFEVGAEFI